MFYVRKIQTKIIYGMVFILIKKMVAKSKKYYPNKLILVWKLLHSICTEKQ